MRCIDMAGMPHTQLNPLSCSIP
jgi:hypothetical protein